jgi:hypothetical protein
MARSFPARPSGLAWLSGGCHDMARNDDKPVVPPAAGAMGLPAAPAGKPADRRPGRLVRMLQRRWWPRFLLAGVLVIVVGATLVSGTAAPWTIFAGGVVILFALISALSNSPADYKRESPMPPGAGAAGGT